MQVIHEFDLWGMLWNASLNLNAMYIILLQEWCPQLAGWQTFIADKNLEFYIVEFVMHIEEKEERFAMLVLSHPWVWSVTEVIFLALAHEAG